MIMAGRGRRLGDLVEQSKKVGSSDTLVDEPASDIQTLTKYINEINLTKVSSTLLNVIQTSFKQMFTTGDSLQNVISELHCKALSDVNFGEKLAISLQQFFCAQVDGSSFRKAIFDLMQSEFNQKDTISQSNKTRFFNSVMLLGNFYRIMTIEGDPVHVLGSALLEYCEMLLKGNEEELELLATQIGLNNRLLSSERPENLKKYKLLQQNLRNFLISSNLSKLSKCWILLIIDLISHESEPIEGAIKDFYVANLGDAYTKLESFIYAPHRKMKSSHHSIKIDINHSAESTNKSIESGFKKKVGKGELSEKFVDLNISNLSTDEFKSQRKPSSHFGRNKKGENQKWQNFDRSAGNKKGSIKSEHDDRFEKDENYYWTQAQRITKSDNQERTKPRQGANKDSPKRQTKNEGES